MDIWGFLFLIGTFKSANYGFCTSQLFLSEHRSYLITPTGASALAFYDCETSDILYSYECKATMKINNIESSETCMCIKVFERDTKLLLLLGYDSGFITLWDYESKEEKSKLKCHPDAVLCLDFDEKFKNRGISGSVDNVLQVWKISDDNQLVKIHEVTVTNPGISSIKIRDDGKIVVTTGQDNLIRVFSWKNMKPLAVLQFHTMPVSVIQFYMESFSSYNTIFASGSKDKNICLWSVY